MNLSDDVGVEELARVLNIGERRIQQLAKEGVIPRSEGEKRGKYPLGASISAYIANLQRAVSGEDEEGTLTAERARLAREQADRIALQNAVTRREQASITVIADVIAQSAAKVCGILEGIPQAIKRRAPGVDQRILRVVEDEVSSAMSQAASIRLGDLTLASQDEQEQA